MLHRLLIPALPASLLRLSHGPQILLGPPARAVAGGGSQSPSPRWPLQCTARAQVGTSLGALGASQHSLGAGLRAASRACPAGGP
eukprot:14977635-Alexandrium_andersonii.AAC.1